MTKWLSIIGLSVGVSSAANAADDFDREFIGENKSEITLYKGGTLSGGPMQGKPALIATLKVPAGSLISMSTAVLSYSIELQKHNPNDANFLTAISETDSNPKISKNGFICNVGILDVNSEDVDEADLQKFYQASNMCLSLKDLKALSVPMGNGDATAKAFLAYSKDNDTIPLLELTQTLEVTPEADEEDAEFEPTADEVAQSEGEIFEVGFARRRLMSPIKNCDLKCLEFTSPFGKRDRRIGMSSFHWGVDLRTKDPATGQIAVNQPVVSVLKGRIMKRDVQVRRSGRYVGAGKYVVVRHRKAGMATKYFHLNGFSGSYTPGAVDARVDKGQLIGFSGNTGGKKGTVPPHLHFETLIRSRDGNYSHRDPVDFLGKIKKARSIAFSTIERVFQQFFLASADNGSKKSTHVL